MDVVDIACGGSETAFQAPTHGDSLYKKHTKLATHERGESFEKDGGGERICGIQDDTCHPLNGLAS